MAAGSSRPTQTSPQPKLYAKGYLEQTRRPLQSLAFLLPILILYEVGILLAYPPFSDVAPPEVMAKVLLSWFMALFGATGYYLPALLVVVALLGWHVYRKDAWRIDRTALIGMAIESVLMALPMLVFHAALAATATPVRPDWADSVLLSMSAGIYEELVFRLALISLLTFLLADVFSIKRGSSELLAVLLSSLIFAAHHCKGFGGAESFEMTRFLFRSAAGLYLAGVFVLRGFGIAVGCHTFYDVIVVTMR